MIIGKVEFNFTCDDYIDRVVIEINNDFQDIQFKFGTNVQSFAASGEIIRKQIKNLFPKNHVDVFNLVYTHANDEMKRNLVFR